MHRSQRELLDDFLAFVGEPRDADARAIAAPLLNRVITSIWLKRPWAIYRSPVPFQLTLQVSQARYSLPDYFGRIGPGQPRNMSRNGTPLIERQPGGIEREFPAFGTTVEVPGIPSVYELTGMSGVHTQPVVTGDALEVLSDSAGDIDVVCAIAGDDANGNWNRNQVTLNGLTPVAIGTWAFVDEFAKAYLNTVTPATAQTSSRGTVTLRKTSNQTEIQKLFFQESSREHAIFTVSPKPLSADVIAIPVIRRPKRAFHDADTIPDLWEPAVFEELQLQWALNTGAASELQVNAAARPELLTLFAHENSMPPAARKRAFGQGR